MRLNLVTAVRKKTIIIGHVNSFKAIYLTVIVTVRARVDHCGHDLSQIGETRRVSLSWTGSVRLKLVIVQGLAKVTGPCLKSRAACSEVAVIRREAAEVGLRLSDSAWVDGRHVENRCGTNKCKLHQLRYQISQHMKPVFDPRASVGGHPQVVQPPNNDSARLTVEGLRRHNETLSKHA